MAVRTAGRVGVCYEMLMCEPGVTNTKTGQDHLSVSGSLGGRTPPFDGGFNLGQLIASSLADVPAGLPGLADCSGNRRMKS